MSTTKKENSTPEKYLVRPGTTDSGKEYEINNISLLALKCCFEELEELWIASHVDGFGEFDDVIMYKKKKQSDRGVAYLMQLKHQDAVKPLTTDMFLKEKGDFSFQKYSEGYIGMQNKVDTKTRNAMLVYLMQNSQIVFIMFTNRRVLNKTPASIDRAAEVADFLIKIDYKTSPILLNDIGSDGSIFQIDYTALADKPNINLEYFKKLYIFTDQLSNHRMEQKIKNVLIENLGNKLQLSDEDASVIVLMFVKFIVEWAKGSLGGHYPLTKEIILRKLVELLLFRYVFTINAEDNDERVEEEETEKNEENNIWYDITKDKDVTVVDDADDVAHRYVRNVTNKIICNSDIVNSITNINRHLMRFVINSKNLSISEKYELLWKSNNIPLVLKVSDERSVLFIQKVLNQFPKVFRVIILNKTKIHFEVFGDVKLFVNLDDLSEKHREYISRKPIKFQGRDGSCIHKLNINKKLFKVKDIVHILCGQLNVGVQFEDVPQFFVEMSLTTKIFHIELLKGSEDIFVVRCAITLLDDFESVLRNQLGIDAKQIIHWERLNQADFNGQIIVFYDLETLQEIETFCLTLTKPVHFLAWHGGDHAELIKSNNIENLKKHKKTLTKIISAKDLFQNFYENKQTVIVSAIPGTGKSVLMNYFRLNMPNHLWVFNIPLAKYQNHYNNWEGQNSNSQRLNFERFLMEITEIFDGAFEQFLNLKNVVFLLDGLDEVPVNRQNGAMQLVKFINQSGYYTCVTTRPLLHEKLESTLNTFAITLNMFTGDDQTSFLRNYFANVGKVMPSNEKVEEFVSKLLEATKSNLNDFDHQFIGMPLQTTLLAEVFENDFLKYLDDGIFKNQRFDLIYLYEHFINKKIKIVCAKVENISEAMINCFKEYRALYSLRHLFDRQDLQELQTDGQLYIIKKLLPYGLQQIQKDGIIVIDGDSNVTFVHQSYAEYLAANWLSENINTTHKEIVRKLIKKTFSPNFVIVRTMFDRILAKNCLLHTAIINRQSNTVKTLILDENACDVTDRGGRTILHLISAWGLHHPDFYKPINPDIDYMQSALNVIPKNNLKHVEDILNYTPLDYAILSRSLGIADTLALTIQNPSSNINLTKVETDWILQHVKQLYSVSLYIIILKCFIRTGSTKLEIDDIHKSIRIGDLDRVRSFITVKNVDVPDSKGCTLLHAATKGSQKDTVRFLLNIKASVNKTDANGRCALHWASYLGHMEIISMLLSHGAKPDATDCYNLTTYHYAILSSLKNQVDTVSLLLSRNITKTNLKLNTIDIIERLNRQYKVHPIYLTDLASQYAVFNLMLSHVEVNMKGWKGMTALMVAAQNDDIDSLKLLLTNNADIHALDDSYETALHYAARKGHGKIVTALLTNNADVNARDSDNTTPLHLAALQGYKDVVTLLLTHNADVEARDSNNRTPLHYAASRGHQDVVTILLIHNADVDARDSDNTTPCLLAVEYGNKDVVTILQHHGADLNARDSDNNTSLDLAVKQARERTPKTAGANLCQKLPPKRTQMKPWKY